MASSAVFGKCVLGLLETRISSFVAGAPEMVSTEKKNFTVGDTVIVDEPTPRNVWPIGRITEVFPDRDGFVCHVRVKTSTLERPITKLCLLESIEH